MMKENINSLTLDDLFDILQTSEKCQVLSVISETSIWTLDRMNKPRIPRPRVLFPLITPSLSSPSTGEDEGGGELYAAHLIR